VNYQTCKKRRLETSRIVTIYALFGLAWIYGSDTVLGWLVHDPVAMVKIAVIKGSLFILCTATLLYYLINRFIRQLTSAETRQIESLRTYEAIFNATNEAIFVHDAQSGHILDINDRMLEIYGYTREEALTVDIGNLSEGTSPYSLVEAVEFVRKAMFEGPQVFEWLSRKKTGELFWSEVSLRRITTHDFDRIIAVVRDVSERKQLDDALKTSEERHRIILDSAMDGFWVVSQQGRLLEVNEAYCRMSGYSKQELLTMSIADFEVNETAADAVTHNKKIMEQGEDRFVAQHRRKDGTVFDVEVSVKFIPVDGGLFVGFLRDITDRNCAEDALQKSEERFRSYILNSPHAVFVTNGNGRFIEVNPAASTITGYSADELLKMGTFDLLPPDSLEWGANHLKQLVETGYSSGEAAYRRKNGEIGFWSLAAVKISPDRFIGFVTDITGRVAAEAELRESEAILKESQRVGHIGHYMLDVVNDIWTSSAELDRIFGLEGEIVRNIQLWNDLLHPEQRDEMKAYFTTQVIGQGLPFNKEYKIQRLNDKSERWVHGLGQLELDSDGHPLHMFGTIQDITDRKLVELEHTILGKQLLHAQKLESLGVLAGGIAHDFNNILTAIIGNADLALMRINKESPVVENLHRIEQAAARAADLAKQMLAYSGKGKFVVENINLNTLLEEMLHMLEVSISKKAVLRFNPHQSLPTVEADATQLRQIIMNLVINASEAIGDKSGVIAITTGCMDCDQSYLKDVWLDENLTDGLYVYLEIADTGCGMDKATMANLFDPFFTTKFTGRGLGMSAVLGIVRGHKGAIKVYSKLNKGTTFKILLPASDRPAELFNGDSHHDDWQGSGTVLLVDDEETVRGIGKEMLQELGFTTITANDGREAVDIFKTTREIDFVVLDLTMPHMDGEQCFRELKQLKPDVKVIISSGYNEQEVTQKFVGKGLAGFIQKPYKLSVLKEAIKKI